MNNQTYPWYIELRKHLLDPFFKSQKSGSIGRMFSTITFGICCYYWLRTSPTHDAPASLLQVFFWTTGYVFANKVVHTTSKHITAAQVPAVPSINSFQTNSATSTTTNKPSKKATKQTQATPAEDTEEPDDTDTAPDTKASKAAQASGDTVVDSDAG